MKALPTVGGASIGSALVRHAQRRIGQAVANVNRGEPGRVAHLTDGGPGTRLSRNNTLPRRGKPGVPGRKFTGSRETSRFGNACRLRPIERIWFVPGRTPRETQKAGKAAQP